MLKSCDADLVTVVGPCPARETANNADKACEKLILEGLKEAYPEHQFLGEETFSEGGA